MKGAAGEGEGETEAEAEAEVEVEVEGEVEGEGVGEGVGVGVGVKSVALRGPSGSGAAWRLGDDVEVGVGLGPAGEIAGGEADDGGAEGAGFADDGGSAFVEGSGDEHVGGGEVAERL